MTADEIQAKLREYFDPSEVEFKPQKVSGSRAVAVAYIDSRCVMDRLDRVFGVGGWKDDYEVLDDGNVVCRLSVRVEGEWVTKVDVGGESDQPDPGDKRKASFSDALKRAAVKLGVGRYLYALPAQWVDFDPQKRCFLKPPQLPSWAVPPKDGTVMIPATQKPAPPPAPAKPAPAKQPAAAPSLPASGEELQRRLYDYDARLAKQGVCGAGDLVEHIRKAALAAGLGKDMTTWNQAGIRLAVDQTKAFEARKREDAAAARVAG